MKRMNKLLGILMALTMVVCLMSTVSMAAGMTYVPADEAAFKLALSAAQNGDTIKLAADIELSAAIEIAEDKTVVLDLNGKVLSGLSVQATTSAVIKNYGSLTIKDSASGGKITTAPTNPDMAGTPGYANNTITNYGTLIVESGTIENTGTGSACYPIDNSTGSKDATVVINGGRIAASVDSYAIRQHAYNADKLNKVTINGGELTGYRAVWVQLPGASSARNPKVSLTINGGTLTSTDNTYNSAIYCRAYGQDGYANTSITITGGTINGDVALSGPSSANMNPAETVSITGGTFNSTNQGIYSYSSHIVPFIEGGSFKIAPATAYLKSGFAVQKSGDYIEVVPVSEVTAPDNVKVETPTENNVSAGISTGSNKVNTEEMEPEQAATAIEAANTIASAASSATITSADDQKAVETAAQEAITEDVAKAAAAAMEVAGLTTGGNEENPTEVHIHVETSLDITVTDVAVSEEDAEEITSITVDITPVAKVIASTEASKDDVNASNSVVVSEAQEIEVTKPVTISIPLPTGFASEGSTVTIVHTKNNGTTYMYEAAVSEVGGKLVATFTNPNGFSTFTVSTKDQLTAAVETAQADATIVLESDITLETALQITNGKKVTIDLNGHNITSAYDPYTIDVNKGGELTIIGEGTIDNTSAGSTVIRNYGTLTIGEQGKAGPTVTRGTTTNGAGNSAVKCEEESTLNIYSGTFGGDQRSIQSWGTTNIYGGTFQKNVEAWEWTDGDHNYPSVLTITGGTFEGKIETGKDPSDSENVAAISITGGTFSQTPDSSYIKDGYTFNNGSVAPVVVLTYRAVVAETENGTVTLSRTRASRGTLITITATPDAGYKVAKVEVTNFRGEAVAVTDAGNGTYTFRMPGSTTTVTVTFESTSSISHLTDVAPDKWYYSAVEYAVSNGLMVGTAEDKFSPEAAMERAMVIQVLYNMEGTPAVNYAGTFSDVADGQWYSAAVEWGVAEGILVGYSTEFNPTGAISREEMVRMMYNYAQYKGKDTSARGDLSKYTDGATTSSWAVEYVKWAVGSGVMVGGNTILNPTGSANRAEVAQIFKNFHEQYGE